MIKPLQDQYNFLDTPRTVVDWDDINDRDDLSVESLSQNSDEANTSEENEEKNADMSELIEADVDEDVISPVRDCQTSAEISPPDSCTEDKAEPRNENFCGDGAVETISSDVIITDLSPVEDTPMKEEIEYKVDDPTSGLGSMTAATPQTKEINVTVEPIVEAIPVDIGKKVLAQLRFILLDW